MSRSEAIQLLLARGRGGLRAVRSGSIYEIGERVHVGLARRVFTVVEAQIWRC